MRFLSNKVQLHFAKGSAPGRSLPRQLLRTPRFVWGAGRRMSDDDGFEIAGYVAFMSFFAFFPFLIFLVAVAGVMGEPESVPIVVDLLFSFMPPEVATVLSPAVGEVIATRTPGLLTFGILATLWTASSGIESLRLALNRAYGIVGKRPLWRRRSQSFLLVVVGAVVLIMLSLTIIFGPLIWRLVAPAAELLAPEWFIFSVGRYLFAIIVLIGMLSLLHVLLPNRKQRLRPLLPGIVITAFGWITLGSAFSIYLNNFGNFPTTYGSLGGIVITLFFLYMMALLFIFGAYLNAALLGIGSVKRDLNASEN